MRLLLHLAAKDVGHLRAEVVLFSAVVALDSLLFATDAGQAARGAWDPAGITGAIALFLTVLLAAQLAQIDSMSRATAFTGNADIGLKSSTRSNTPSFANTPGRST